MLSPPPPPPPLFFHAAAFSLFTFLLLLHPSRSLANCSFPAIFNFGDSNSDTGGFVAAFPSQSRPYGQTTFREPSGRSSDGRLVIDFLAEALGLPYLSPYLQSVGSNFRHGANFAIGGSSILSANLSSPSENWLSPFNLGVQVNQFKELKLRALKLFSQGKHLESIPKPDEFSASMYTIDIGHNDFVSRYNELTREQLRAFFPQVVDGLTGSIQSLYSEGARNFLITNLGPLGCLPGILTTFPHATTDLDASGCIAPVNEAVAFYNSLLRQRVAELMTQLSGAWVVYTDTNSIKYDLARNGTAEGFRFATKACCGGGGRYNYDTRIGCGRSAMVNGELIVARSCAHPSVYVSWDGIHYTEAANHHIAMQILSNTLFFPSLSLSSLCHELPM